MNSTAKARRIDWKFEVVVIPVSASRCQREQLTICLSRRSLYGASTARGDAP
jgi:hypothetical protein